MKTIIITSFLAGLCLAKSVPKTQVWYYYNREGVSDCAEPSIHIPCTSEMHITGTKEYYPYYVWTTFEKNGTKLNYKLWFNFNNTQPVMIDTLECTNQFHSSVVHPNIFDKLQFNFNLTFNSYCKFEKDIVSNFTIYQETNINNKLQSNFTLIDFINWEPIEHDTTQYYEFLPIMEMHKTPPPSYYICKYCDK